MPANINLGLANYEKGQYRDAYNSFIKALNISPGHPEALLATATIIYHHSANKTEETRSQAITDARSAISQDPRYSNLSFLRENLWGPQLVTDTAEMFGYMQSSNTLEL